MESSAFYKIAIRTPKSNQICLMHLGLMDTQFAPLFNALFWRVPIPPIHDVKTCKRLSLSVLARL